MQATFDGQPGFEAVTHDQTTAIETIVHQFGVIRLLRHAIQICLGGDQIQPCIPAFCTSGSADTQTEQGENERFIEGIHG
ncbi:hypothetical protein KAIAGNDH_02844 [Aeromonas salmonicida]